MMQTKLAMLPPLTSSPPQVAGNPISSAIQRIVCRFDLGRHRRESPGSHVLVERGRQEIAEHPNRRRARRDVAEKARVAIEHRVIEQHVGRLGQQPVGSDAFGRQLVLHSQVPAEQFPATGGKNRSAPSAASPAVRQSDRPGGGQSPEIHPPTSPAEPHALSAPRARAQSSSGFLDEESIKILRRLRHRFRSFAVQSGWPGWTIVLSLVLRHWSFVHSPLSQVPQSWRTDTQ